MANRAYFINSHLPTSNYPDLLRIAKSHSKVFEVLEETAYRIPLHWLVCFRAGDVHPCTTKDEQGREWTEQVPYVKVGRAIANLKSAWHLVEQIIGDTDVSQAYLRYALNLLYSLPLPFLTMHVSEVVDGQYEGFVSALSGTEEAIPFLENFADYEEEKLPFDLETWQEENAANESQQKIDACPVYPAVGEIVSLHDVGETSGFEVKLAAHSFSDVKALSACLVLDDADCLLGDEWMVCSHQPGSPGGAVSYLGGNKQHVFRIEPENLPAAAQKVIFAIDWRGQDNCLPDYLRWKLEAAGKILVDHVISGSALATSAAVIVAALKHENKWQVKALAKMVDGGMPAIFLNFGGTPDHALVQSLSAIPQVSCEVVDRPGINLRWEKNWKSLCKSFSEWRADRGEDAVVELEYFARHGQPLIPIGFYLEHEEKNAPYQSWEKSELRYALNSFANLRLQEFEFRGVEDGVFDTRLALDSFAAQYIAQLIDAHGVSLHAQRLPAQNGRELDVRKMEYVALGVVLGCYSEAFRLGCLYLRGCQKFGSGASSIPPVRYFMLQVLADFLNEPLLDGPIKRETEPILDMLYERWRIQNPQDLVSVCVAACDVHTHRSIYSEKNCHEFADGGWGRIPVEMLLVFRLRSLLGLANPVIDHPLMATALGKLPEEISFCPSDLMARLRQRMKDDGYEEEAIFSGFGVASVKVESLSGKTEICETHPSKSADGGEKKLKKVRAKNFKRRGVCPFWIDQWNQLWQEFQNQQKTYATADRDFFESYIRGRWVGTYYDVIPPVRLWEQGLAERLNRYAFARLMEVEKLGMAGRPFDSAIAVEAFAAKYLEQLILLYSHNFHCLRFGGTFAPKGMRYTAIPFTALGVILGCDKEAFELFRLQHLAEVRRNFGYERPYPVFNFLFRILADFLGVGPWFGEKHSGVGPLFNNLFENWRTEDAEKLVPLCLAVCDLHTWNTRKAGFEFTHEFGNGKWSRIPIEILLLFDLRQRLGLTNPSLDHPLMQTPLGILPAKTVFSMSDLLKRLRERIGQEGFDEETIGRQLRQPPQVAAKQSLPATILPPTPLPEGFSAHLQMPNLEQSYEENPSPIILATSVEKMSTIEGKNKKESPTLAKSNRFESDESSPTSKPWWKLW